MEKAPQKIKLWLSQEGRKVSWLASAVGVDQASLSRWINGHQQPRRENRVRLAKVTSLDVSNEESWI